MALVKVISKPVTGTPLSYWRPCFWTVYSDRIELTVDGFFSPEIRGQGLPPDAQFPVRCPVPETFPAGTRMEQGYALMRTAVFNGIVVWADAEDYLEDPWRNPPAVSPENRQVQEETTSENQ
jgi:hypothetical protein